MHYLKILARKKITKVKVLSISTIFILLSLVGNSCSSRPDNEIEFWTMQLKPDFTEYFDELISDFEARDTNNQILWLEVPWSKMKNKIFTQGHRYGIKLYQAGETAILASGAEFLASIAIGIK